MSNIKYKYLLVVMLLALVACQQPPAPVATSASPAATTQPASTATIPSTISAATPATTATTALTPPAATVASPTVALTSTLTASPTGTTATTTVVVTPSAATPAAQGATPATTPANNSGKIISDALAAISKLKSYEATLSMKTNGLSADNEAQSIEFKYQIAADDRWTISGTVSTPNSQQISVIRIGDNVYVQDPTKGDIWIQGSAGTLGKNFEDLRPDKLLAGLPDMMNEFPSGAEVKPVGTETLNGVQTTHYNSKLSNYTSPDGSTVEQSNIDIWIAADGGYPIRLDMNFSGTTKEKKKGSFEVHLNIENVNGNIQINPPPADKIISASGGGSQPTPTKAP